MHVKRQEGQDVPECLVAFGKKTEKEGHKKKSSNLKLTKMNALTILQAVLYMNDSESMDVVDFSEYDDRSSYDFLKDFFGVSGEENIKGVFTKGRWFYSYCQKLGWPDWREREERGEKLEPDVKLTIDDDTVIYLYRMDD